jgi:hypothetical protein
VWRFYLDIPSGLSTYQDDLADGMSEVTVDLALLEVSTLPSATSEKARHQLLLKLKPGLSDCYGLVSLLALLMVSIFTG